MPWSYFPLYIKACLEWHSVSSIFRWQPSSSGTHYCPGSVSSAVKGALQPDVSLHYQSSTAPIVFTTVSISYRIASKSVTFVSPRSVSVSASLGSWPVWHGLHLSWICLCSFSIGLHLFLPGLHFFYHFLISAFVLTRLVFISSSLHSHYLLTAVT